MVTAQSTLQVARSYIGYCEKKTNEQLEDFTANAGHNNWNRFAAELDAVAGFYNGPKNIGPDGMWCDIFVDACVYEASGCDRDKALYVLCQPLSSAGAGCLYSANYYKQAGRWSLTPKVGAQIFFSYRAGEVSHTGLVESIDGDKIRTIEGNAIDMVASRLYSISDSRIYGYGLPRYDDEEPTPEPICDDGTIGVTTLRYGDGMGDKQDKRDEVEAAQSLLILRNCPCGWYGADGEFGNETRKAVLKFQQKKALPVTGEVDTVTWDKLVHNN